MKRYGLIGYPLGHSFSRAFFSEKFLREGCAECVYENFPLNSIESLPGLLESHPDLAGLNVTIPYKKAVIPYLDKLDPIAAEIGAVNCIRITRRDGTPYLTGYNADAWGFERSLTGMVGPERPDALILGTGGASQAVAHVLAGLGILYRFVSRTGDGADTLSYGDLTPDLIRKTLLLINTTPLGTYPDIETAPAIPYEAVGCGHFLHDLVYNPAETAFLRQGRIRGATVRNGYAMLVGQAERSWQIWNKA